MSLSSLLGLSLYLLCVIGQLLPKAYSQDFQTVVDNVEARMAVEDLLTDYPDLAQDLLEAENELQKLWTSYFPDLLQQKNGSLLSPGCRKALTSLLPEVTNDTFHMSPALIPLLDTAGKQGAGLLDGNTIWDGAYDECFSYNFTGYCKASKVTSSLIPADLGLSWVMGFCVPGQCNSSDVATLISDTELFQVDALNVKCTTSKMSSYSGGAITMLIVTSIFVFLVAIGTLVDALFQLSSNNDVTATDSIGTKVSEKPTKSERVKSLDFITAFSLYKTVPTLLATKQAPSVITSLNGLRVISMFWVILSHTQLGSITTGVIDNMRISKDILSRFTFQPITNGFFAVDSFFFLSAVLVAYLTLREMKKKNGRFPALHFCIHRYLRLTPTYAFVLFFAWALTANIAYGPGIGLTPSIMGDCTKVWWTNFLYINNLYPWKEIDECMRWTWYLANDMQFYVISPVILLSLYHFRPLAAIILSALLGSSFIITASLVAVYDLQSTIFAKLAYNYSSPSTGAQYNDLIYVKPWGRIAPCLVGLVLGYLLFKEFRIKFRKLANTLLYLLLWVVAGVLLVVVLYGLYFSWHGHALTKFENVMYISFSRFAWAIGLALMVLACHNGYGFFINSFLSMKIWTPLSRMTFNAYLVHPVVLFIIYGQLQKTFHYTNITLACFTLALTVLSFGVAGVICVTVEFPLGTIEMLLFKLVGIKGRESQRQANVTNIQEDAPPEVNGQDRGEAENNVNNHSLLISNHSEVLTHSMP